MRLPAGSGGISSPHAAQPPEQPGRIAGFQTQIRIRQPQVLLGDYVLVSIHAEEIKSIAVLMQEDEMVEGTFQMRGTEKEHFRKFSEAMGKTADRIAQAAEVRSQQRVITAIRDMTEKSCLACHKALRIDPFLRSWRR